MLPALLPSRQDSISTVLAALVVPRMGARQKQPQEQSQIFRLRCAPLLMNGLTE